MNKGKYLEISQYKNSLNLNKRTIHFGFSILKSLLAFSVVISHCFNIRSTKNHIILFIVKKRRVHVPSFVIMSFYFNYKTFISFDNQKKIDRFERLLIPFVGWPIIIFIFSNIFQFIKRFARLCSLRVLIFQLITGQGNGIFHFWYLFDLMLTTFIFHLIIILSRNNYLFILNLLLLFSYFIQYSKYSRILFSYTKKIGGFARENEIIPFAVTGFTLSSLNITNIVEKYKIKTFFICLIIYNLIQEYQIFTLFFGVAYNGIKLNVASVCLIIIFSLFHFKKIENKYLIYFLKYMTNYSGGIFYLHQAVHCFFQYILKDINKGSFFGIIMIYFICHLICISGSLIFKNTKAKNLFS